MLTQYAIDPVRKIIHVHTTTNAGMTPNEFGFYFCDGRAAILKQFNELIEVDRLLYFTRVTRYWCDIVMNADRQTYFTSESAKTLQRRLVRTGTLTGG